MRRSRGQRFRPVLRGALLAYALAMFSTQVQAQSGKQIGAPLRAPAAAGAGSAQETGGLEALPTRAAGLIRSAERLLASGQADEAWRMLQENVAQFAGDPRFDYMLGLAAIDSGRPGQAIFALERVLMVRPDFLPARAEIARAYFMVREHENARREFAAVSAERIPEAARQTIGLYLDAIQRAADAGRPVFSLRAEFETGYDSNANFGSASGLWLLADGTGVTPLPASRPRSSTVLAGAMALDASGQFSDRVEWVAGARASARYFPRVPELDQQQFDISGGLTLRNGCQRLSALALLQHLQLDGSAYRNATGGVLQWQCEVDSRTMVGASFQAFDLDYPSARIRDARRTAVGVNAARLLDAPGRPILVASLAAGQESSKRGIDHLGHDFVSARVGLVARIAPNWRASANLSWERRKFGGAEPIFGLVRNDRQTELRVELERKIDERTSLVPHLIGTRNASTLSPNDFRRVQAGVLLRHRF